jgi:hypothetical protein
VRQSILIAGTLNRRPLRGLLAMQFCLETARDRLVPPLEKSRQDLLSPGALELG